MMTKTDKKILIYVPHTGTLRTELAAKLINLSPFCRIAFSYAVPHDSNRNKMVKDFLRTSYEWLIMIDSDIIPPSNLASIVETDKKIISAVCHGLEYNKPRILVFEKHGNKYKGINSEIKGEKEVDAVGTGCIAIHRSVFEAMKPPYFKFEYNEDGIMNKGEDIYFCEKAKELGFKIYVNGYFQAMHVVDKVI